MKVYIAGPMTGIPHFNFRMFALAAAELRYAGYTVVSPAEVDQESGFDPFTLPADYNWHKLPPCMTARDFAKRDTALLLDCDAIHMLPGWEHSKGARAEHALAVWAGLEIRYE